MNGTSSLNAGATPTRAAARTRRWFFPVSILLATGIVLVGFAPTFYFRRLFHGPSLTPLLFVHGIVFSAWFVLLIVQSALVNARRVALHRRLGALGAALAVLMVGLGVGVAIRGAAHHSGGARVGVGPLEFLIMPLGAIAMFAALVASAIYYRRNPATHKRLMLLATIDLLGPAIARLLDNTLHIRSPIGIIAVSAVLVAACSVFDRLSRGRVHPVFGLLGPAFLASFPLRFAIARSDAWLAIATWLTS